MPARSPVPPQTIRRRWRQRSLLTLLGLVFAVSAVLRIGSLEVASAQAPQAPVPPRGNEIVLDMADPQADSVEGLIRPVQAALDEVLGLRDSLSEREAALSDRETAVAAAQALVEDRLGALEAAERRLQDLISLSDSAAETDLDRLTRVYETMAPDQAAPLFERMSPSFAAGFLARMTPAAGAEIMAEMTPEAAYAVSVVIATRNVDAPRDDDPLTEPTP